MFKQIAISFFAAIVLLIAAWAASAAEEHKTNLGASIVTGYIVPHIPAAGIKINALPILLDAAKSRGVEASEAGCWQVAAPLRNPSNWTVVRNGKSGAPLGAIQRITAPEKCLSGAFQAVFYPGAIKVKSGRRESANDTTLHEGDELELLITMPAGQSTQGNVVPESIWRHSAPVMVPNPTFQSYTIELDPKTANDQELLDGSKKNVLQLGLKLDVPAIGALSIPGTRTYFTTDNVLSTESKDARSKIDVKLGIEKSLLDAWYVPGFVEAKYLANQSFSNTSTVATAGVKTILPWGWTHPLLWNRIIRVPFSPIVTAGVQYEKRLKRDPLVTDSHVKENLARLAGELEWNPIYLIPGDEFDDLSQKITLAIKLKGWYFPDERATGGAKVRRAETYTDISLFVPLTRLPNSFFGGSGGNNPGSRLKLQYERGANEANGFTRSESVKLGVEIATQ